MFKVPSDSSVEELAVCYRTPSEKTTVNSTRGASPARRSGEGRVQYSTIDLVPNAAATYQINSRTLKRPAEDSVGEIAAGTRLAPKRRKTLVKSAPCFGQLSGREGRAPVEIDLEDFASENDQRNLPRLPFRRIIESSHEHSPYDVHEYDTLRQIGKGANGRVLMVKSRRDGTLRACKSIIWPQNRSDLPPEVDILGIRLPENDRVTCIYEAYHDGDCFNMFMKCFNGGDLDKLIDHYDRRQIEVPEAFIWHASHQLSEAPAFIHEGLTPQGPHPQAWTSIIHADIKPENVLLQYGQDRSEHPSLILSDFGHASTDGPGNAPRGTQIYRPPEIPYCSKMGDVWAFGATIYSLARGNDTPVTEPPYRFSETDTESEDLWDQNPSARASRPTRNYSSALQTFLSYALAWKMQLRPSALQVLKRVQWEISNGATRRYAQEPLLSEFYPTRPE